jgi:hypothetical protein
MRGLIVMLALLISACPAKEGAPLPIPDQYPALGTWFDVGDQRCRYLTVHAMPCLFCEGTSGWGNSMVGRGGQTCDWSKWQPPPSLQYSPPHN